MDYIKPKKYEQEFTTKKSMTYASKYFNHSCGVKFQLENCKQKRTDDKSNNTFIN